MVQSPSKAMGRWHHNCEKESKEGSLAKGSGSLAKRVQKLKVLAKLQAVGVQTLLLKRLRLTERPTVTLQERPEEEVKTEEVAVKEEIHCKRVHRVGQTSVRLMLLGKGPMQILMLTMSHLQAANRGRKKMPKLPFPLA